MTILFGPNVSAMDVSAHTRDVIERNLRASGNDRCLVTSSQRSPFAQARVMYENLEAHGVSEQRRLYKPAGNKVIDAYVASQGKPPAERIAAMEAAILAVGPENVSRHCANPRVLGVVDIAPSSLKRPAEFRAAAERDTSISKVLGPPTDPALHLEIPQPRRA